MTEADHRHVDKPELSLFRGAMDSITSGTHISEGDLVAALKVAAEYIVWLTRKWNECVVSKKKMKAHVDDLQSGMYVNCVYCGFRYGPKETTPVTMADALKEHVERCEEHPMSKLRKENEELKKKAIWCGDDERR